jgi:toxin ParE1/3/4
MEYKVFISTKAQKEIENAIDYYSLINLRAQQKFAFEIIKAYSILIRNPFFAIRYNKIRSLKINKFPYSLFYTINSQKKTIDILAFLHQKKHPRKLPRK